MEKRILDEIDTRAARNDGADLLRIVAMLMVTVMHIFVRGGVIFGAADIGPNFYLSWIVQALCEVATDCFFLLSGYFLVNRPMRPVRAVELWATVLFYSWGIYAIFLPLGLVDASHTPLLGSLLPVSTNNYWFITCYLALYFLSPYLNLAIHAMEKKQMRNLIITLLALFSLWPTLAPMVMTFEHHGGMDVAWSLVIYFCAAYVKLHVPKLPKKRTCLAVYIGCSAVALVLRFVFSHYGNSTVPGLLAYMNTILTYNSPLTFTAAAALFFCFIQLEIRSPGARRAIRFVAPTVLASYLITEQHNMIDYIWKDWPPVRQFAANWWFLPYVFALAVAVLLLCCVVDRGRAWLFQTAARAFRKRVPRKEPGNPA